MKFFDTDGREHSKDIRKYKLDRRRRSASRGQKALGRILCKIFPNIPIYTEMPCWGTNLRLDYFIPNLGIVFEFDGIQHSEFNPHFHGTKKNFLAAKNRDHQKERWCEANDFRLIRVTDETLDNVEQLIEES